MVEEGTRRQPLNAPSQNIIAQNDYEHAARFCNTSVRYIQGIVRQNKFRVLHYFTINNFNITYKNITCKKKTCVGSLVKKSEPRSFPKMNHITSNHSERPLQLLRNVFNVERFSEKCQVDEFWLLLSFLTHFLASGMICVNACCNPVYANEIKIAQHLAKQLQKQ